MDQTLTILGIAGSLRNASYNRALLQAAQQLVPPDVRLDIFDLAGIPLFNQDHEPDPPGRVIEFRESIRAADAVLISTPEYNHGMPGVLKNAIDWGSRPSGHNSWNGKPIAIMGASPGTAGTIRAQIQLRECFATLNLHAVNRPFVTISGAAQKFDAEGNLTDEPTKDLLKNLLDSLVAWTRRLAPR
jgi:chromate reductase